MTSLIFIVLYFNFSSSFHLISSSHQVSKTSSKQQAANSGLSSFFSQCNSGFLLFVCLFVRSYVHSLAVCLCVCINVCFRPNQDDDGYVDADADGDGQRVVTGSKQWCQLQLSVFSIVVVVLLSRFINIR